MRAFTVSTRITRAISKHMGEEMSVHLFFPRLGGSGIPPDGSPQASPLGLTFLVLTPPSPNRGLVNVRLFYPPLPVSPSLSQARCIVHYCSRYSMRARFTDAAVWSASVLALRLRVRAYRYRAYPSVNSSSSPAGLRPWSLARCPTRASWAS